MERREFIKAGLVVGVVAGTSMPSAFGNIIIPTEENMSHGEMERFLKELDISMEGISRSGGDQLKALIPDVSNEHEEMILRSNLRSLLLVGTFSELSIKGQTHPWMQKRMQYSAPEISYSVNNSFEILKNLSSESKEEIAMALTEDSGLGNIILNALDNEAKTIGITAARRRQLKVMGRRIIRRLKHSPYMLIEEYVRKTEKLLSAKLSKKALERLSKKQLDEETYERCLKEAEEAALHWKSMNIPEMPVGYDLIINEDLHNLEPSHPTKVDPTIGLIILGIGVSTTAVGLIFLALAGGQFGTLWWIGAILGITLGPIMIIVALLVLIVTGTIAIIKKSKAK